MNSVKDCLLEPGPDACGPAAAPAPAGEPPGLARLAADDAFWAAREALLGRHEQAVAAQQAARRRAALARRVAEIPARYREPFDPGRARLSPRILEGCERWTPEAPLGIGLCGGTGLGKTRALCAILQRLSCTWLYLPAGKLSIAVAEQWDDSPAVAGRAVRLIRSARAVRVLLLDDLGDEKHTEAVTAELKDLVEHRTSRKLPILWTSNLTPAQITAKHGERGAAMVRRLAEFSWTP